jgi:hypothetical protein
MYNDFLRIINTNKIILVVVGHKSIFLGKRCIDKEADVSTKFHESLIVRCPAPLGAGQLTIDIT